MTNLGTYVGLTPTPGIASSGCDINDNGQITGQTNIAPNGTSYAYVRSAAGAWTLLPMLEGGTWARGSEISESGTQVVGQVTVGGKEHGVLWTYTEGAWSVQDLGLVGGTSSGAADLSEATGQIVGYGTDAGGNLRALIVEPGDTVFQDLTALTDGLPVGVYLQYAVGLNDSSWIVGLDSQNHAYLLAPNPVPLPGTLVLLGSGLAGLAGWRRLRQG